MTYSRHSQPFPDLAPDQIHVWRVPLNQNLARIPELKELLSPDERARAERFRFDKDRNQFIESRAALRLLLSQYLNVSPTVLTFSKTAHGKPALANGQSHSGLHFNLSRRDGLALVAIARNREIGIDVELIQAGLPFFEIANVSFSENELAILQSLPESQQAAGFYNCWTRKEAYVKARGEGFSFPLKQFDVSLTPGAAAKLLEVRGCNTEVDRWTLQELSAGDGYVAALMFEGPGATVTCRDLR
ncbi:MAG: 4-phosphopantetheinyl transferase [Blastocatellia bacterium]|nr:4-phosphopantetheinyl transferase [Blastocatellia bacterium]